MISWSRSSPSPFSSPFCSILTSHADYRCKLVPKLRFPVPRSHLSNIAEKRKIIPCSRLNTSYNVITRQIFLSHEQKIVFGSFGYNGVTDTSLVKTKKITSRLADSFSNSMGHVGVCLFHGINPLLLSLCRA